MLTHEKTIDVIGEVLAAMSKLVASLRDQPDAIASSAEMARHDELVARLIDWRQDEPRLLDEAWSWIFERPPAGCTYLQLYGRLAFISYELFHYL